MGSSYILTIKFNKLENSGIQLLKELDQAELQKILKKL